MTPFERVDSKRLESYAQAKRYLDKLIPQARELAESWAHRAELTKT